MIYSSNFNLALADSFENVEGAGAIRLNKGLLVVYKGTMPPLQEFLDDYTTKYFIEAGSGGANDVIGSNFGTEVLAGYGRTSSKDANQLVMIRNGSEIMYDAASSSPIAERISTQTGTCTWAMLTFGWHLEHLGAAGGLHLYPNYPNLPAILLEVSDTSGTGQVKLSNTDTTTTVPDLVSIGFNIGMA